MKETYTTDEDGKDHREVVGTGNVLYERSRNHSGLSFGCNDLKV